MNEPLTFKRASRNEWNVALGGRHVGQLYRTKRVVDTAYGPSLDMHWFLRLNNRWIPGEWNVNVYFGISRPGQGFICAKRAATQWIDVRRAAYETEETKKTAMRKTLREERELDLMLSRVEYEETDDEPC